MCGRFTMVTWDELLNAARHIEARAPFNASPDWPVSSGTEAVASSGDDGHLPLRDAFPGSTVPVLCTSADERDIFPEHLAWGYESDEGRPIFNTRIETASKLPLWRESFYRRHCIVPVHAFYETDRSELAISPKTGRQIKQSYRFTEPDGGPMLLAGIWQDGRFSLLTAKPNDVVGRVHDRMPYMVDVDGAHEWLLAGAVPGLAPQAGLLNNSPIYPPLP